MRISLTKVSANPLRTVQHEGSHTHIFISAYLDDFLPVLGGVHGGLGQKDLAVAGVDVELLWAKGVVPQVLHVIPVPDNAVLHGVVDLQHGAQLAGLVPDHQILERERSNVNTDKYSQARQQSSPFLGPTTGRSTQ